MLKQDVVDVKINLSETEGLKISVFKQPSIFRFGFLVFLSVYRAIEHFQNCNSDKILADGNGTLQALSKEFISDFFPSQLNSLITVVNVN